MKLVKILTGLLIASQVWAAESNLPARLQNKPGLSAPLVCKPYLDATDSNFIEVMKLNPFYNKLISNAKKTLKTPIPELDEEALKKYDKTGTNRYYYTAVYYRLTLRLRSFVQGYVLTGDARYVRGAEDTIREYCKLDSWALPKTGTRIGKTNGLDLISTEGARDLALALAVMKHKMEPAVYDMARSAILTRIIEPMEKDFLREKTAYGWAKGTNNWNAVCNGNLISTAACILWDEPERMTKFIDGCLRSINYSLEPFQADGYCSEGGGYWNYGVGHYLDAALIVYVMTDGKQNLLDQPAAQKSLSYAYKIRMSERMIPAFADCSHASIPSPENLQKIDFLLGKTTKKELMLQRLHFDKYMLYYLAKQPEAKNVTVDPGAERVSTFPVSGVAVCRPLNTASRMSAAWKGGSNHENHNHNDVGSFAVGIGDVPVLCDPEKPPYAHGSFGPERYKNPFMGSFGHSVPLVDGKQQIAGKGTDSKLLKETREKDFFAWEIDILPAYRVPGVKELVRTFSYAWGDCAQVTVSDRVKSERPIDFETALTSPGKFKEIAPGELEITCAGKTLLVKIDTGNVPYEFKETVLKGHKIKKLGTHPTRFGIRFKDKVTDAKITLTITEMPKK